MPGSYTHLDVYKRQEPDRYSDGKRKGRDRTEKSFLECTSLSFIKHLLKTMVFICIMKYQS